MKTRGKGEAAAAESARLLPLIRHPSPVHLSPVTCLESTVYLCVYHLSSITWAPIRLPTYRLSIIRLPSLHLPLRPPPYLFRRHLLRLARGGAHDVNDVCELAQRPQAQGILCLRSIDEEAATRTWGGQHPERAARPRSGGGTDRVRSPRPGRGSHRSIPPTQPGAGRTRVRGPTRAHPDSGAGRSARQGLVKR